MIRDQQAWSRLGSALKQARERAGLTQTELAKRANVSNFSIQTAETGKIPKARMPYTLARIARALGWPPGAVEAVLKGDEPPADHPTARRPTPPQTTQRSVDANAALSHLALTRRTELQLSPQSLADRTTDTQTGKPIITESRLNELESGQSTTAPQLHELHALADALELPLRQVQDAAAAQFLGIQTVWAASGEARALVAQAERLTPEQRQQLLRLIEAFAPNPDGARDT